MIVNPDATLKKTLFLSNGLRSYVKDVGIDLVEPLLSHVEYLIGRQIVSGEHERVAMLDVIKILTSQLNVLKAGLRREDHVLAASAFVIKGDIHHLFVFAIHCVAVEGLHGDVLAKGIGLTGLGEFLLSRRKLLNDLFRRDAGRLRGIEVAL